MIDPQEIGRQEARRLEKDFGRQVLSGKLIQQTLLVNDVFCD